MKNYLLSVIVFALSLSAFGSGYQLYSESATDVLGIGGAAVARSGHASSAWYNPAATLSITVPTFSGGGSFLRLDSEYTTSVGTDKLDDQVRMTGFGYGVIPLGDDYRLTLSVNVPYGMITQWGPSSQLSSLATFTSLRICYISPGIAIRLTDELSVAAGVNAVIGVARMANYIDLSKYGISERNKLYMRADSEGFGGFASVFWRPAEDWAFGAHYQSTVRLKFKGTASYRNRTSYLGDMLQFRKAGVDSVMRMPGYVALGVENSSLKNWRFMFDVVWSKWSEYNAMVINFDKAPGTGKPGRNVSRRNWHDVWSYRFGAEYQLTDKWVLRGGYMLDLSAANDRTRAPEMPDGDKNLFALGFGYQTPRWGFDFTYAYVFFDKGPLGSHIAKERDLEIGEFNSNCQIFSAQLTLRF